MKPNYDKELKIFRPVLSAADKAHLEKVIDLVTELSALRPSSGILQNGAKAAQTGLDALCAALCEEFDPYSEEEFDPDSEEDSRQP